MTPAISKAIVLGIAVKFTEDKFNQISADPANSTMTRGFAAFDARFLQVGDAFSTAWEFFGPGR